MSTTVSGTLADMKRPLTLRDYPEDVVRLACDTCGRRGGYWKPSLVSRFGLEISLPDLRFEIAQCERQTSTRDPCGVHFVGITSLL